MLLNPVMVSPVAISAAPVSTSNDKGSRFIESKGHTDFHFVENDLCIRKDRVSGKIVSVDIDSGSAISGRLSGLGFFVEEEGETDSRIRMRSLTVSNEEIFPRDLGLIKL